MDVLSLIWEKWSRERKENRLEQTKHRRQTHSSSSIDAVRSNLFLSFVSHRSIEIALLVSFVSCFLHAFSKHHWFKLVIRAQQEWEAKQREDLIKFRVSQLVGTLFLTYVFLSHPNKSNLAYSIVARKCQTALFGLFISRRSRYSLVETLPLERTDGGTTIESSVNWLRYHRAGALFCSARRRRILFDVQVQSLHGERLLSGESTDALVVHRGQFIRIEYWRWTFHWLGQFWCCQRYARSAWPTFRFTGYRLLGISVGAFELNSIAIIQLLGWVFLPVFVATGVSTLPEYMSRRFGGQRIRIYIAFLYLVLYILTKISVNIYASSLFINYAFHWNIYLSVLFVLALTALGTVSGGLASVMYTDTIQAVIMVFGGFVLMVLSFSEIGGMSNLYRRYLNATPAIIQPDPMRNITNLWVNRTALAATCGQPTEKSFRMLRSISDPDMPWLGFFLGHTPNTIWSVPSIIQAGLILLS